MKHVHLFLFALVFAITGSSIKSVAQTNNGAYIVTADTISLGEIYLDELSDSHGKVQVNVSNTGNQPLILHKVTGCCGTNIKQWTKAPILPNKSGVIDVEFRPEYKPQSISRTVTIESNATNGKSIKIHIVGVVIARKSSNEIEL